MPELFAPESAGSGVDLTGYAPGRELSVERDSKRLAREWNREIEAELRRLAGQRDDGWGRIVVWTVLEVLWLVAVFAVLGVFSRLH